MWDLIVSVPDHCLSFYFLFIWLILMCSFARFPYIVSFILWFLIIAIGLTLIIGNFNVL